MRMYVSKKKSLCMIMLEKSRIVETMSIENKNWIKDDVWRLERQIYIRQDVCKNLFVTFTSAPNKQSVIIRFNIRSDTHFNFQLGVKFSKNECRVWNVNRVYLLKMKNTIIQLVFLEDSCSFLGEKMNLKIIIGEPFLGETIQEFKFFSWSTYRPMS